MFDGEENYHTVVDLVCFNMDLEIQEHSKSIASAKKIFEKIEKGTLKPDIAIVAGFLEKDHEDGEKIVKRLKELVPDIKIIAYSILDDADWGDIHALKTTQDMDSSIMHVLEQMTDKTFKTTNAASD